MAENNIDFVCNVDKPEILEAIFSSLRQGESTNKLTKINSRKNENIKVEPFTNIGKIKKDDFTVAFTNFDKLIGLKTSTHQLFDALIEEFTKSGAKSESISLSLKNFMKKRGLKDEKTARKQIKDDLDTLSNIKITFTQKLKGKKKTQDYIDLGILQTSKGIVKGMITVYLDTVFFNLIKGYNIMPYPKKLWQFNNKRNPNSFYFLRKISEHKNMNIGKPNEDIISVDTLLASSPEMPTYEEVSTGERNYTSRIIEPFERDMDACEDVITWEYCHSNGTPLTDEELKNMNYEIFIRLLVKIHWKIYPDQSARLQKKNEEQKAISSGKRSKK